MHIEIMGSNISDFRRLGGHVGVMLGTLNQALSVSASRPLKTRGSRNHGFSEVEMPLPRSTGAEFLETGSRNPPPQGAKRPGAPPKAAPGGFLEPVSKNSAPVDLGRGIFEPGSQKSALPCKLASLGPHDI